MLCATRLEIAHEGEQQPRSSSRSAAARSTASLMVLRSPYIAGIALWVACCRSPRPSSTSSRRRSSPRPRTIRRCARASSPRVDLAVGLLTLALQFVATGKLIARFGVGPALALLPLVFAAGFAVLAAAPVLAVVIAFQALQRTANFAISNPAREVLFTVVERDEKYKAKNVIDIVAVRGADAAGGVAVHRAARARHGGARDCGRRCDRRSRPSGIVLVALGARPRAGARRGYSRAPG